MFWTIFVIYAGIGVIVAIALVSGISLKCTGSCLQGRTKCDCREVKDED